jgi:5-methyltetrahydrofolate--homocysteine methyltransferase
MGTALIARGLSVDAEPPEAWNITQPDVVREIHRRYADAGCGALQSNTFGGNRLRLRQYGLEDRVAELNEAGVAIARRAAPDGVLVFASVGPTGAVPPPQGDADLVELEDAFAEQAAALAASGIALLHLETLYHPKEVRAALRGCRHGAPGTPVVTSFACTRVGPTTFSTSMGFPIDTMISVALEERVDGLGVNCSLTPAEMRPVVERLVSRCKVPVFAQPIVAAAGAAPLFPAEFAAGVLALFEAGARVVGGCCGTSPTDLAACADALALS